MKLSLLVQAIIGIVIAEVAGAIGSVFTMPNIPTWYASIVKPTFSPPNWIFGPVWTTLFALMGIAAAIVWRRGLSSPGVKAALILFGTQLLLNILWSAIFFGMQNPGGAFIEIVVLWLAILATIIAFFRISAVAGWLLIPYILWVSFASFLNYNIWTLNR